MWDRLVFWDEGLEGIKPCPCCGGIPILKDDGYMEPEIAENGAYVGMNVEEPSFYWVECKSCELSTKTTETPEECIALWNKRTD